jgi:hypothetical protein
MMEKDESTLVLPWVRYHGALFGFENLYVFDNGSTDRETLLALDEIETLGAHVDRNHNEKTHFALKGEVLGIKMAELRDSGRFDFLIPLDCDEFFALQDGDGVSFEPSRILARLAELKLQTGVPTVRFSYLNVLGSKDRFIKEHALKTFVQAAGFLDLDHGFHFVRSSLSSEMVESDFVYIHCHAKPYDVIVRHSREKLSFWCDVDDPDALSALEASNGPGWHLVRYLQMTEREYLSTFQTEAGIALPGFAARLATVGADSDFLLGRTPALTVEATQVRTYPGVVRHPVQSGQRPGNGVIVLGAFGPHLETVITALGAAGIAVGDPAEQFIDRRWMAARAAGDAETVKRWLLTRAAAATRWAVWLPDASALDAQAIEALRWPRVIQVRPTEPGHTDDLVENGPDLPTQCRQLAAVGVVVLEVQSPTAFADPFLLAEALLDFVGIGSGAIPLADHLDVSYPDTSMPKILIGHVDCIFNGAICGWALLKDQATGDVESNVTLRVLVAGSEIDTVTAGLPRDDVRIAVGGNGLCGFEYTPPVSLKDGSTHAVDFTITTRVGTLANSPFNYSCLDNEIISPYVACHRDIFQKQIGFHDSREFRLGLNNNVPQSDFVVEIGDIFPDFSYGRLVPNNLFECHNEFSQSLEFVFSETNRIYNYGFSSKLFLLRNVYIYNSRIHHISGNRVLTVYETARPPDRPFTSQPEWTPDSLRAAALRPADPVPLLFLGSAGYLNYGHWLIDDLPRAASIALIKRHARSALAKVVTYGTHPHLNRIKQESISLISQEDFSPDILFIPNDKPVYFDQIYYATPVSYHPNLKSPEACRFLRDSVSHIDNALSPDRIFICRRPEHGRAIENQNDVERVLTSFGFRTIDVETMSFEDQVSVFRNAAFVAGCMGAAMTTSVFSKPGTRLLYFAPSGWIEPFYWDLASVCGHSYTTLYGRVSNIGRSPHQTDFSIDINALRQVLTEELAAS